VLQTRGRESREKKGRYFPSKVKGENQTASDRQVEIGVRKGKGAKKMLDPRKERRKSTGFFNDGHPQKGSRDQHRGGSLGP